MSTILIIPLQKYPYPPRNAITAILRARKTITARETVETVRDFLRAAAGRDDTAQESPPNHNPFLLQMHSTVRSMSAATRVPEDNDMNDRLLVDLVKLYRKEGDRTVALASEATGIPPSRSRAFPERCSSARG